MIQPLRPDWLNSNPFDRINSEEDAIELAKKICSTDTEVRTISLESEKYILSSIIFYLHDQAPQDENNFFLVKDLLVAAMSECEHHLCKTSYERLLDNLREKDDEHTCVRKYDRLKSMTTRFELNEVLNSCLKRIHMFDVSCVPSCLHKFDDMSENGVLSLASLLTIHLGTRSDYLFPAHIEDYDYEKFRDAEKYCLAAAIAYCYQNRLDTVLHELSTTEPIPFDAVFRLFESDKFDAKLGLLKKQSPGHLAATYYEIYLTTSGDCAFDVARTSKRKVSFWREFA